MKKLQTINTDDLDSETEKKVLSRKRMIMGIIGFVGNYWSELKTYFLEMKRKCDHWESIRKERGPDVGGCQFCPAWNGKECPLKDKWVPMFKREVK